MKKDQTLPIATTPLNALTARHQFGTLLNQVYFGNKIVQVTRSGKPMAYVVSHRFLERTLKRLPN